MPIKTLSTLCHIFPCVNYILKNEEEDKTNLSNCPPITSHPVNNNLIFHRPRNLPYIPNKLIIIFSYYSILIKHQELDKQTNLLQRERIFKLTSAKCTYTSPYSHKISREGRIISEVARCIDERNSS